MSKSKKLKDDDKWNDMIDEYNDRMEDRLDDYKLTVKDVKKNKKLKKSALKGAEAYFEDTFDVDVTVKKAMSLRLRLSER